ncbi:MAG: hypothetical protein IPF55_19880 [Rhodoferax sp.]|nr:hypothetical protein [Rhodoferax sp.]
MVTVPAAQAIEHGLLRRKPRRSDRERSQSWIDDCKSRRGKPGGTIDLCVARVVLDMIAGAAQPSNPLQKSLAAHLPKADLVAAGGVAKRALAALDASGLGIASPCHSGSDPKDLWRFFSGPGGPLAPIAQALALRRSVSQGEPACCRLGRPAISIDAEWSKECLGLYRDAHHGQSPVPLKVVDSSRINRIRAYDNLAWHFIRDEQLQDPEVQVLDGSTDSGWNRETIAMDGASTAPNV